MDAALGVGDTQYKINQVNKKRNTVSSCGVRDEETKTGLCDTGDRSYFTWRGGKGHLEEVTSDL